MTSWGGAWAAAGGKITHALPESKTGFFWKT